jgi:hypothetical protein
MTRGAGTPSGTVTAADVVEVAAGPVPAIPPVKKTSARRAPKWEADARDRVRVAARRLAGSLPGLIARDAALPGPITFRNHWEVARLFDGLELVAPGLVSTSQWRSGANVRHTASASANSSEAGPGSPAPSARLPLAVSVSNSARSS